MTLSIDYVRKKSGWCPNAPSVRTAPAILIADTGAIQSLQPDGGPGGSGRVGRGVSFATGSIRTLVGNKRLLWFSLITGLVIAFLFTGEFALRIFGSYPHPAMAYPVWLTLTFALELVTVFSLNLLLTGLIISVSPDLASRSTTVRDVLSRVRSIFGWSVIMSVIGTGLFVLLSQYPGTVFLSLFPLVTRFPLNFILEPSLAGPGPIASGWHAAFAAASTLLLIIINVVLIALTLFVVPVLILEHKRLRGAVAESAALFRKTWAEILGCVLVFVLALLAISLVSVVFLPVYLAVNMSSPFWTEFWYKGGWIAVGVLYILAWCVLTFIGSTAVGIAILDLYSYGKTGRLPEVAGKKRITGSESAT
jgi:hypothetical protein